MKHTFKIFTLLFLIVIFTFSLFGDAYAQKAKAGRYEYSIAVDPIDLLNRDALNVTFEFQTDKINSVTFFGTFYNLNTNVINNAFALGASYRWYPNFIPDGKKCIEGFAIGPFLNGIFYDGGSVFGLGPEFAYKWVFGGFVIEPTMRIYILMGKERTAFHSWGIGVNIGYAW